MLSCNAIQIDMRDKKPDDVIHSHFNVFDVDKLQFQQIFKALVCLKF